MGGDTIGTPTVIYKGIALGLAIDNASSLLPSHSCRQYLSPRLTFGLERDLCRLPDKPLLHDGRNMVGSRHAAFLPDWRFLRNRRDSTLVRDDMGLCHREQNAGLVESVVAASVDTNQ